MINLMKKLDGPEERQTIIEQKHPDKLLTCEHFNFLHPNFGEEIDIHKEKNIEVLKTRISYWLGHYWVEFDEMIIKPWLCYQWPWNYTDNMNVKRIILTNISKYEEEERHKKHFIRGETPINNEENENNKENLLNKIENTEYDEDKKENNNMEFSNKKRDNKNYVELSDLPEGK